jgi:hypothetical protein
MVRAAKIIVVDDDSAIYTRCQNLIDSGQQILDHGTARAIASKWCSTKDAYAFVSTGAIPCHPETLIRQFCPPGTELSGVQDVLIQLLELYLIHHGPRAAIEGWDKLWVR